MSTTDQLFQRLSQAGFSNELIRASLPDWWTEEESKLSSAKMMVSMLLAQRLSLEPKSLLDDNVPLGFLHTGPTKFKHMRLGAGIRRDALIAYAQGVARVILLKRPLPIPILGTTASELRKLILESDRSHVAFGDILSLCWSLGIPVVHLRVFPAKTKGVTAMAARVGQQHCILVARESGIPAQYMFHVAHELGHICLGHLKSANTIVDLDPNDPENAEESTEADDEELEADRFAQELLTGNPEFSVDRKPGTKGFGTAQELAQLSIQVGNWQAVDPGHIAMCFGSTTGEWSLAMAAAKLIPDQDQKPGALVNKVFWNQIGPTVHHHSKGFLEAVAAI